MENKSIRLIIEPIEVIYEDKPLLEKKPGCPDKFIWRDQVFKVKKVLSEWHDYRRSGRMSKNMQPQHASRAAKRGSWGVGSDFYLVETHENRIFVIYYDRSPQGIENRKGSWHLEREYY